MFKFVALIASLVGVSAFVPVSTGPRGPRSALKMGFENEVGALPPVGFWDPCGKILYHFIMIAQLSIYVCVKHFALLLTNEIL
jgi:hypothetical protein